mmetsp:Transcript_34468/g.93418  ORF Transcript_34468/g.93418 Transcript_34468/m.93418 type:complete len:221 (-) Transcript_34468:251-913(-)
MDRGVCRPDRTVPRIAQGRAIDQPGGVMDVEPLRAHAAWAANHNIPIALGTDLHGQVPNAKLLPQGNLIGAEKAERGARGGPDGRNLVGVALRGEEVVCLALHRAHQPDQVELVLAREEEARHDGGVELAQHRDRGHHQLLPGVLLVCEREAAGHRHVPRMVASPIGAGAHVRARAHTVSGVAHGMAVWVAALNVASAARVAVASTRERGLPEGSGPARP